MDTCDRCGWEDGRHAHWCWRITMNALARQEIGELPKLPPEAYDDPPF